MKKEIILGIAILVISAIGISAMAVETGPKIKTLGILGSGIAISPTDSSNFELLKVGVARVVVGSGENKTEVLVGVLHLDNQSYVLKNVTIGNGTISGLVYFNSTQVGSFSVQSAHKSGADIWFGTLTISGTSWNVYILEAPRKFKPAELAEKVSDLCESQPEKCKTLGRGVGPALCEKTPEDSSCREKIKNFCELNPNDQRCVSLLKNFCRNNTDDARCTEEELD